MDSSALQCITKVLYGVTGVSLDDDPHKWNRSDSSVLGGTNDRIWGENPTSCTMQGTARRLASQQALIGV
jgi:hypothetical protein